MHPATLQNAQQLASLLAKHQRRIVLAESCTAGNVAGALAVIPGISSWLCGSFVIYRNDSKTQWLGIARDLLEDPQVGPVSQPVTLLLAQHALAATPEADLAAAVTGHIGPGCPDDLDGHVFFSLTTRHPSTVFQTHCRLSAPPPQNQLDVSARTTRMLQATNWVLQQISAQIQG
ncbi:MAG: CinA family protein [Pirellulaceae bacterium]|nr:CinA family protein [Pirellulaceae bacterium]